MQLEVRDGAYYAERRISCCYNCNISLVDLVCDKLDRWGDCDKYRYIKAGVFIK